MPFHANYNAYHNALSRWQATDPQHAEVLQEEIDIVTHKLKYIAPESRPSVAVLLDVRTLTEDTNPLTRDALSIAGGIWAEDDAVENAHKIIFVQQDAQLYRDLPVLLAESNFSSFRAVRDNQIYVVQQEAFGNQSGAAFLQQIEIFAEIAQPKYFIYGHAGTDWIHFDLEP